MHPIIQFIKTYGLNKLSDHGVSVRWSMTNGCKFSLNYDQYTVQDGDPISNQCRGLILESLGDAEYRVLAQPFPRFYNYGTPHAAVLDWSTAVFEEKLDGTLCIVYYDHTLGRWCVATRNVPDADVVGESGKSFSELFWLYGRDWFFSMNPDVSCTYCCELTGPGNQIVVPYSTWATTLLGIFHNETGTELPVPAGLGPQVYSFLDVQGARQWLEKQPGHKHEGFVVRDVAGNRVKIKSEAYFNIVHSVSLASTDSGLMSLILLGKEDDIYSFLPQPKQMRIDFLKKGLRDVFITIEAYAASIPEGISRKELALQIQEKPEFKAWIGPIMELWTKRHTSMQSWLAYELKRTQGVPSAPFIERILRSMHEEKN